MYAIACRHPFLEANKSTAFATSVTLLSINLVSYAQGKTGKAYHLRKPEDNIQSEDQGKIVEMIAKWGEGSDREPLKRQLVEEGFLGKKAREPTEEDVKRFIKSFLSRYITE